MSRCTGTGVLRRKLDSSVGERLGPHLRTHTQRSVPTGAPPRLHVDRKPQTRKHTVSVCEARTHTHASAFTLSKAPPYTSRPAAPRSMRTPGPGDHRNTETQASDPTGAAGMPHCAWPRTSLHADTCPWRVPSTLPRACAGGCPQRALGPFFGALTGSPMVTACGAGAGAAGVDGRA